MNQESIQPRIVICILHDDPKVIEDICSRSSSFEYDHEYSGCGVDENIPTAFEYSWDRVNPSASEEDIEMVNTHKNVAYIVSKPLSSIDSINVASEGLSLIEESFLKNARAVKCESSGIAHGKDRWIELSKNNDLKSLYYAFVRRPLGENKEMYSCGLHLLGMSDIKTEGFEDWEASRIIDAFSMYLIAEGGIKSIEEGHTFSCSPDDPVLSIRKADCSFYEEDDFFFNPYGYWVLKEKKGTTRKWSLLGKRPSS